MADTWTCERHNRTMPRSDQRGCPDCGAEMDAAEMIDPATMTGAERRAEIERWAEQISVPVDRIMRRISQLVGRPVMTHEIGLAWTALLNEAESDERGVPLTEEQLIEPLREVGTGTIVVRTDQETDR